MNIENIELQYKNRKRHIYPRQKKKKKKFYLKSFKLFMPKSGIFFEQQNEKTQQN